MKGLWRSARIAPGIRDSVGDHSQPKPKHSFVVECYWPGMIENDARNVLDRVTGLAGEALPGRSVRSLGCVLLPSDGMALFLFKASSEDLVRSLGQLAEVPFDRIVESILFGFGEPRPDRQLAHDGEQGESGSDRLGSQ